jgi:hypothetical protein
MYLLKFSFDAGSALMYACYGDELVPTARKLDVLSLARIPQ